MSWFSGGPGHATPIGQLGIACPDFAAMRADTVNTGLAEDRAMQPIFPKLI